MKRILVVIALGLAVSCIKAPQPVPEYVPAAPYGVFHEGMIANITPEGWLKETLVRQKEGLTGHPEAMAYPYNSCLWAGVLDRDSETRGSDWWRYEQTAYYLDGLTRVGYLIDDREFLDLWQENIEYVLANPLPATPEGNLQDEIDRLVEDFSKWIDFDAQVSEDPKARAVVEDVMGQINRRAAVAVEARPEGRLGSETEFGAWPFAVFFRAVQAYYEATGDPRIPEALEKHFLSYSAKALSLDRFVVNVEGLLWTYSITGNEELLRKAVDAWGEGASNLTQETCLDDSEFRMHGVTMNELMKIPMILYMYTGEEQYLKAALHADYKMETPNMLIDGVNSSTEALAGNDPLASHETCDISDYTWTIGYYLMGTGDAQWADRIEKAIFNAGFGAVTKDFRTMQYFSCPNQFIATGESNHNDFKKGLTWMAYRPVHETECCIGNVHRYFPNYVARMWLKDASGHPVAALYGPSSVTYDLGEGLNVCIEEKTEYPFEEKIDFEFTFYKDGRRSDASHHMNFTYRIPLWCKTSQECGFHTVSKEWKSGETFSVQLPMEVELVENPVEGLCVQRGPVVYSYAIPMDCVEDTVVYDYLAGKVSANPDFKCWNMTPSGKWNYALVEDRLDEVKVEFTGSTGYPFDLENAPVKISVPVVGVKDWILDEDRYTPALPDEVVAESDEVTFIDLVPYGSTTLRLTTFPVY
ncbi:MAG: glycoside hydrolase family 127 protein [Bacteroidales bacterium]|nr:glycoside hydrolase family 127 protein [Bacteroidales bacterium]